MKHQLHREQQNINHQLQSQVKRMERLIQLMRFENMKLTLQLGRQSEKQDIFYQNYVFSNKQVHGGLKGVFTFSSAECGDKELAFL